VLTPVLFLPFQAKPFSSTRLHMGCPGNPLSALPDIPSSSLLLLLLPLLFLKSPPPLSSSPSPCSSSNLLLPLHSRPPVRHQEYQAQQDRIKAEPLMIVYSYWDGAGHRREIKIKKGDTVRAALLGGKPPPSLVLQLCCPLTPVGATLLRAACPSAAGREGCMPWASASVWCPVPCPPGCLPHPPAA